MSIVRRLGVFLTGFMLATPLVSVAQGNPEIDIPSRNLAYVGKVALSTNPDLTSQAQIKQFTDRYSSSIVSWIADGVEYTAPADQDEMCRGVSLYLINYVLGPYVESGNFEDALSAVPLVISGMPKYAASLKWIDENKPSAANGLNLMKEFNDGYWAIAIDQLERLACGNHFD